MKKIKRLITPRHRITFPVGDDDIPVALDEIVYVTSDGRASSLYLTDGTVLKINRQLSRIEKQLKKYPQFAKPHKSYVINMDKITGYEHERKTYLVFNIKNQVKKILTTPRYQRPIKKYFKVRTLKNIIPFDKVARILKNERIKNYDKDIRFFSREDLDKEFGAYTSENIIKTVYIKNIIWQLLHWIKSGKAYPIEGNIRSLWYSHIKPVFSRLEILDSGDDKIINKVLVELTYKYKLFKYADLGLADENRHNWKIGDKNPHIIVFAEKSGHLNTLEKINEQGGVSIIALGGQPSHLTTEYFATALFKKLASSSFVDPARNIDRYEDPTFYLYSILDWDPSGWFIKKNFLDQLEGQGITKYKIVDLITPKSFKPEELEFIIYRLNTAPKERTKNRNWIKATGGVNGTSYGIEADAMNRVRLRKLFFEKAAEHFKELTPSSLAMISDKRILNKLVRLNLIPADQQTAYV